MISACQDGLLADINNRENSMSSSNNMSPSILKAAWQHIAPVWPLGNMVATNPLQGYESYHFAMALDVASGFHPDLKKLPALKQVNRETIKWCQVLLDENQAAFSLPDKQHGILASFIKLLPYDKKLAVTEKNNDLLVNKLTSAPQSAIDICLSWLEIPKEQQQLFATLLLTTLPGWAGYVKYLAEWRQREPRVKLLHDYLALRLIITTLLWPEAKALLSGYTTHQQSSPGKEIMQCINSNEKHYMQQLSTQMQGSAKMKQLGTANVAAQFVFCIDARSEMMRREIEACGAYQTFGYAGFFGIPLAIEHAESKARVNACPPFVVSRHVIQKKSTVSRWRYHISTLLSRAYQSLKYSFNTPFLLVDLVGIFSGLAMLLRTFAPALWCQYQHRGSTQLLNTTLARQRMLQTIGFQKQCQYAQQFLLTIGLTSNFADNIFICAHESESLNNAYASALDCGACGGVSGRQHAELLAAIMNEVPVRQYLRDQYNIHIPQQTVFHSAVHVTSTDELVLHLHAEREQIEQLQSDTVRASEQCRIKRLAQLHGDSSIALRQQKAIYAHNWSQIRPEWGLANNASLIIGHRLITQGIDLQSRAFLHSYDWTLDGDNKILATIFAGPVMVAYWINMAYLFAVTNNTMYGSGSKITQNITGQQNTLQGNASDVMMGLPMQSLYEKFDQSYHQPVRLRVVVYAPRDKLKQTIRGNKQITQLVVNEWLFVYVLDPEENSLMRLTPELEWRHA